MNYSFNISVKIYILTCKPYKHRLLKSPPVSSNLFSNQSPHLEARATPLKTYNSKVVDKKQ